jgi:hypothetical protein
VDPFAGGVGEGERFLGGGGGTYGGSSSSTAAPQSAALTQSDFTMALRQILSEQSVAVGSQTEVFQSLVATMASMQERTQGPGGVQGILGGSSGLDMGAGTKLSGAKGYAAMNYLETEFNERSVQIWKEIERAWQKSVGADIGDRGWRVEEVFERVPWQTYRTLIRMSWILMSLYEGLRRVGDPGDRAGLNLEELHRVRARCALALCAAEQASLDGGTWDLGWQFVHLPEPPFQKLSKVAGEKKLSVHATGISKVYVAAGLAVLRDEQAILDRRAAQGKGAGKGKGKPE